MANSKPARSSQGKKQATDFIKQVRKRDGSLETFDLERIANAIYKAMLAAGEGGDFEGSMVANKVFAELVRIVKKRPDFIPGVEEVQDLVEKELILSEYVKTAKQYILYRQERAKLRQRGVQVPEHVQELTKESKKYFRNPLAEFVYYRTYSRWLEEEGRRETWVETVERYVSFMKENLGSALTEQEYEEVRSYILNHSAMPSMRLMQFAGKPARRDNVPAYNCSFIAPCQLRDFGEIMYLSMCGTGVGFSVESQNVEKLPQIKKQNGKKKTTHVVGDSKEGWADAFVLGLETWFNGGDIDFDYSKVRPAGAKLKTMGGKSSGPEPLKDLMVFTRDRILTRQGRRLSSLDVHDIICKIGEIVVAGGVRRSALISLSDLDDQFMRDAKKGQFYLTDPQRAMANNSAVYDEKPTSTELMKEWLALMESGTGERGIFNRGMLEHQLPERRKKNIYKEEEEEGLTGTNPCGEIILQSKQFCNLTEVVARPDDTEESLLKKTKIAAILGTYQSTLTNFTYLSEEWKKNCEEERLLGVSITGQWDCSLVRDENVLKKIKKTALETNRQFAKRFGVNESAAVTCVKPSGTVSQLVDSASGMHPRYAKYYIRRVRISATDSLFQMLKDQGVPYHPEVGQTEENANTFVLEFPVKAPEGAITKDDLTAMDQLKHWKKVKKNYTEHNPSVTISVGEEEWISTVNWLYKNWEMLGGLSFLPRFDHVYKLAPYEEIDEKTYREMAKRFTDIDFSKIVTYESTDNTEQKRELACSAGACEI